MNGGICKPRWLEANVNILSCRTVHYYAELGQCTVFSTSEAPEQFVSQVTILKYFAHYMEENLMDVSIHTWCKTKHSECICNVFFPFISQCQCFSNSTGWWFAQRDWYQQAKAVSPTVAQVGSCTHDALQRWHFSGTACILLGLDFPYCLFLILPELLHKWPIVNFQLDRWTFTTITPRSYCATRMRSTCWRTSTRNACPQRSALARCSAVDAPRTCEAAWSTPSTCCSRGATEHHESAGWRPCSWLSHFYWWTSWTYIHWNVCSVGHEPSAQTTELWQCIWGTSTGPVHRNYWIGTFKNDGELGWNQKRPLNGLEF